LSVEQYITVKLGGSVPCRLIHIQFNKNVDIKISAHDAFLEKPSSGTLKIERFDSQITLNFWEQ